LDICLMQPVITEAEAATA